MLLLSVDSPCFANWYFNWFVRVTFLEKCLYFDTILGEFKKNKFNVHFSVMMKKATVRRRYSKDQKCREVSVCYHLF